MINTNSSIKTISFTYDVVRDGGTQIQHLSGAFLPEGAFVLQGNIKVITTFTDAGGTSQIGLGSPGFVGLLLPTSPIAMFAAGNVIATAAAVLITTGRQVTIDVINEDLLTGRFICTLQYNEFSE